MATLWPAAIGVVFEPVPAEAGQAKEKPSLVVTVPPESTLGVPLARYSWEKLSLAASKVAALAIRRLVTPMLLNVAASDDAVVDIAKMCMATWPADDGLLMSGNVTLCSVFPAARETSTW